MYIYNMKEYTVLLTWDDEARVWVAENNDIPLIHESGSLDALMERCRYSAPELLAMNGKSVDGATLKFVAERRAAVIA